MGKKKRIYRSPELKFKVSIEATKGLKTVNEIAVAYKVSPSQVSEWKQKLLAEGINLFRHKARKKEVENEQKEAELYEQIGRLKMELEWLKKKLDK